MIYTCSMSRKIPTKNRERVLYTLPSSVVQNVDKYAQRIRKGNKSGFVADAIEAYIKLLKKKVETERIRDSYIAAAEDNLKLNQEWQFADAEIEKALQDLEREKE